MSAGGQTITSCPKCGAVCSDTTLSHKCKMADLTVIEKILSLPDGQAIMRSDTYEGYFTGLSTNDLKALVERLHKADGMANEINILTKENRGLLTRPINQVEWPPHETVETLVEAVDHLLKKHDCDGPRYEEYSVAAEQGRAFLSACAEI